MMKIGWFFNGIMTGILFMGLWLIFKNGVNPYLSFNKLFEIWGIILGLYFGGWFLGFWIFKEKEQSKSMENKRK